MANYKEVAYDMGSGAVAGVVDQFVHKTDIDRLTDYNSKLPAGTPAAKQVPWTKRYGTYYNYGVPLLTVGLIAMNRLRGTWATRLAVIGGQLAGREALQAAQNSSAIKNNKNPVYYRPAAQIVYAPQSNPQPVITHPSIPIVAPPNVMAPMT